MYVVRRHAAISKAKEAAGIFVNFFFIFLIYIFIFILASRKIIAPSESTSPAPPTEMDADTGDTGDTGEKMTETSKDEKPVTENKTRVHGSKGRGRGGWMSRRGMRGGRGMMKGFGPPGNGRGRMKDVAMNGLPPMRGMGRMQPYPDLRGHRGRRGPMGMGPPHPPPPPPPPPHLRGPFPPFPRHGPPPPPPPPGHPGFRGRPPHPRGRGIPPPRPPCHFQPCGPRGYHNGPVSPPPHPPPGRGQRWPGPPGGRRF